MLCRHHASGGWWRGSLRSLPSASRRPRRWPAFRPLGCRKPAFPASSLPQPGYPDAPVLSQLTASSRVPLLPSSVRGRLRATYPNYCLPLGLAAPCPPAVHRSWQRLKLKHSPIRHRSVPTPRTPRSLCSRSKEYYNKAMQSCQAGVASACRAASLFLTIARLEGGAVRRPEMRLCCRSLKGGRCPWGAC
jgi:hypothetical protein